MKQAQEFLVDDMRMDEEMLRKLDWREIAIWESDAPKKEEHWNIGKNVKPSIVRSPFSRPTGD